MYKQSSSLLLHWLKVPDEPHPPFGNPASLRVFRAGKNYFNLRLATWALGQVIALAGIVFWLWVFIGVEQGVQARRQSKTTAAAPFTTKSFEDYLKKIEADEKAEESPAVAANNAPGKDAPVTTEPVKKKRGRVRVINGWAGFKRVLVEVSLMLPTWSFPLLWVLKIFGFVVYLVQVPLTYAARRLDYEMRWYMVTDRSLRIRHGVWKVSESTMSFANLQQVMVSQGPLQRLLGLSDVKVKSAGGGTGHPEHEAHDMHTGIFHSVTNGAEIRDLILERLRRFRETGLGDPDEKSHRPDNVPPAAASVPVDSTDVLAAARELAAEARALRASLG